MDAPRTPMMSMTNSKMTMKIRTGGKPAMIGVRTPASNMQAKAPSMKRSPWAKLIMVSTP
jgi:hypothetical protein